MCSDFNTSGQAMAIEPTRIVNSNRNLAKNKEAQCFSPAKYLAWDYFQKNTTTSLCISNSSNIS